MKCVKCSISPALFLAACVGLPALCAADSLVTVDGEILMGAVTQTPTGYTVQSADGPVNVPSDRVRKVLYDHPPVEAPAAAPRPTVAVPAASHKAIDPRSVNALIAQGQAAMSAAEYGDARDAFKDALQIDRQNPLAARGLGFAYVALGKPVKGLEALEIAAAKSTLDRSLVLALSSALVANHNSMRAVRYLTAYLQAHADPVDEPMLNALGIALTQTGSSAVRSQLYKDAAKLYREQNTALESTHDGKRRWGVEWLDKEDVDKKDAERAKAQEKVDLAFEKLQTAQNQEAAAESALNSSATGLGTRNPNAIRVAETNVTTSKNELSKVQATYDDAAQALAALPAPTFPEQIVVDDADLLILPGTVATGPGAAPPANSSAVAMNTKPAKTDTIPPDAVTDPKPAPVAPPVPDDATLTPPTPAPTKPPSQSTNKPARHLTRYAVGFAIAPDVLVTAASAVEDASTITVTLSDGRSMTGKVLRSNHADGLALLKVDNADLPCLAIATAADDSALACLGYPEVDLFNPVPRNMDVTADAQGDSWTVRFAASPRLPGGPLLQNNAVVGVELGDRDGEPSTTPAATLKQLAALVADDAKATTVSPDPKKAVVQITAER